MADETEAPKEEVKKTTPRKTATTRKTAAKKPAPRKTTATKPAAKKVPAKKAATPKKTAGNAAATKAPAKKASTAKKPAPKTAAPANTAAEKTSATASAKVEASAESAKTNRESNSSSPNERDKFMNELKDKDWLEVVFRGFFMVIFGVISYFVLGMTFLLAVVQFVVMILTGEANGTITNFIRGCAKYIGDVLDFLSFRTEEKPFPFGKDLPDTD